MTSAGVAGNAGALRGDLEQLAWNISVVVAGPPATVATVGLAADGLPVGVQIVGARYADRTTIRFAELLADVAPPAAPGH